MKKYVLAGLLLLGAVYCFASSYNTVSVTSAATVILPASRNRAGWMIHNVSTSTVYIGSDSSITTANAVPLLPGEKILNSGGRMWNGVIRGIGAANTSSDIRYFEWSDSEVSQ